MFMLCPFARSLILKQIDLYGKVCLYVALWYSLFARSLILKQINLYGKAIITQECITHRRNFIINDIILGAIGVNITWRWRHQPLSTWTLEMLYAAHILGAYLPLCEVSQKSMGGISRYLGFSKKRVFLKKAWLLSVTFPKYGYVVEGEEATKRGKSRFESVLFIGKEQILTNVVFKTRLPWLHQCWRTRHDDFKMFPV